MALMFTICYGLVTVHLRICNIVSNENLRYYVSRHIFNANTIHNGMQLKYRYFLTNIRSLPNDINIRRICTSNVICGSGEMVSGATCGEFFFQCEINQWSKS